MLKTKIKRFLKHNSLIISMVVPTALSLMVLTQGCGKRRPPQPPIERTARQATLRASQSGSRIVLEWQNPSYGFRPADILRVDIYRLAEAAATTTPLTEEDFAARSNVIGSVAYDRVKSPFEQNFFADTLNNPTPDVRLQYAIRFVNKEGQSGSFSNFVAVVPNLQISLPPSALRVESVPEGIKISWQNSRETILAGQSISPIGVNIYRRETNGQFVKLNSEPIRETDFVDRTVSEATDYSYVLRSITRDREGSILESDNSMILQGRYKDTFAPSPPQGLTIAAAPSRLALFFAANTEDDIAGYNIYRTETATNDRQKAVRLNDTPTQATAFQDDKVESGKIYFYFVTATDKSGNESRPSETVSEKAP